LPFVLDDAPLLLSTIPEANFPMTVFPSHLKFCGPIALESAPAEEKDPQLVAWIKRARTIIINLGTLFRWNEQRTKAMADALAILVAEINVQVLWKFHKISDFSDEVFSNAQKYIDGDRIKVKRWLEADPLSSLSTGHVVLSVHHGGANCYHEAVL
jgi:predicted MPP superfamily phosphohydrolase